MSSSLEMGLKIPESIQKRMLGVTEAVNEGSLEMGVDSSKICVIFNFNDIVPNPHVRKKKDGQILLEIPLLFLIEPKDFVFSSPERRWMKRQFKKTELTDKDIINLSAFEIFMKNSDMARNAKKFVLYHELSHIALGHLDRSPIDNAESRKREKEADLMAAHCTGHEGAVYLFNIMSKFDHTKPKTHPSYVKRIEYLRPSTDDIVTDPNSKSDSKLKVEKETSLSSKLSQLKISRV